MGCNPLTGIMYFWQISRLADKGGILIEYHYISLNAYPSIYLN